MSSLTARLRKLETATGVSGPTPPRIVFYREPNMAAHWYCPNPWWEPPAEEAGIEQQADSPRADRPGGASTADSDAQG